MTLTAADLQSMTLTAALQNSLSSLNLPSIPLGSAHLCPLPSTPSLPPLEVAQVYTRGYFPEPPGPSLLSVPALAIFFFFSGARAWEGFVSETPVPSTGPGVGRCWNVELVNEGMIGTCAPAALPT